MTAFAPVLPDPDAIVGKHALMNVHAQFSRGRTQLEPRSWRIPYQWQPAHYQDSDDEPFLLLLNSSGGFVEGDVAHFHAHLEAGTRALFTTANSSKFYKCLNGRTSVEIAEFTVGGEALLEFLPDEAIPFRDSRVERRTRIDLAASSRMFATDMISAGRIHFSQPELFDFTSLLSDFVIQVDGRPLAIDRIKATGSEDIAAMSRLWGGARHMTTVFIYAPDLAQTVEDEIREAATAVPGTATGVSRIGNLVVMRSLASETWQAHAAVFEAWRVVRPGLADKPAREIRKC